MTLGQQRQQRFDEKNYQQRLKKTIERYALSLSKSAPFYLEPGDLEGVGYLAALEAEETYVRSRGKKLTWAMANAVGKMQHYIRKEAQLRGIPSQKWEQKESQIREVLQETGDYGKDGMADEVVTKVTVEQFLNELSEDEKRACEQVLNGTAQTIQEAVRQEYDNYQTGANMGKLRRRQLERKLRCFLLERK